MAATTVNGKLLSPLSGQPASAQITIQLVDYDDTPVIGFNAVDSTEILATDTIIPTSAGLWTAQLVPNADIQLTDGTVQTAYRVTESGDGAVYTYWIIVTATSPAWAGALRTTLVGNSGGSAAAMAIAGALTVGGPFTLDGTEIAAPPGGTALFLRADGAWVAPPVGIHASGDTTGATDTAAITAAIAAASSAGSGKVVLAAGSFTTTLITLPTNVVLEGAGSGATTLTLAAGQNTDLIRTTNFASLTGTDSTATPYGFQVRGITLDGNKAGQTSGTGNCLSIYGYGFVLEDVITRNAMGWGIWSEWGSASAFNTPNGMESYASHIKCHDNNGGTLNFIGPHDSQWSDGVFVQNVNYSSGKVAFQVPTDGRANGSVFRGVHVYGGAYDYGVLAASAGVQFEGCQFEGALVGQMLVKASQVVASDCRWFWGSSGANTTKGIILGDASHTNLNGIRLTGKIENCSGGVIDLTYATGGSNFYQLLGVYVSPFAVPSPAVISSPGSNDTATITVTNNSGVTTSDSLFQVPNTAKIAALTLAGVSIPSNVDADPLGYGYATTHPWAANANGAAALFGASAALYQQLIGYGMSTNQLRIFVGTSSGNISVGLYNNGGQSGSSRLPNTRQATTGAIPCPASGMATVTLTTTVTIGRSWYGALSCDNTSATFQRSAPQSSISNGVAANQGSAHPLPATAGAANGGGTVLWMATA